MARPGEKITRKTIMMQNKMKELDLKEKSSKSLLANVLDMDDDFVPSSQLPHSHIHQVSQHFSSQNEGALQCSVSTNSGLCVFDKFLFRLITIPTTQTTLTQVNRKMEDLSGKKYYIILLEHEE